MTHIDTRTWEIWNDNCEEGFEENSFEVDEVIAPLIQLLNKKGYVTRFCCSGHPGKSLNEAKLLNEVEDPWKCIFNTKNVIPNEDGTTTIYFEKSDDDFYISFADGISWDTDMQLPDGCYLENETVLRYEYKATDYFAMLRERLEITLKLMAWAEALPNR